MLDANRNAQRATHKLTAAEVLGVIYDEKTLVLACTDYEEYVN
jgi:hypothetical protein